MAVHATNLVAGQIEVIGNIKTRTNTILQEITFATGDVVTNETIDRSTQAIKDLGLFKAVNIQKVVKENGLTNITFVVEEKHYNFVLPKVNRNGDGDITTGIVWRSDNLFGKNQQSKVTLAYREFSDADEETEKKVAWEYSYPRITNSPYSLDFTVSHENTTLEETVGLASGRYERERNYFRLLVGRWFNEKGPSQGIKISLGPQWEQFEHEYKSGTMDLLPDLTAQALVSEIDAYYVHDHLLSRSGQHFRYRLIWADDTTGSEISYIQHFVFFRKYIPLSRSDHSNLNLQFRLGYTSRPLLGPPQFKVGGSKFLRGYDRDEVEGNSFLIFNAEWLHPVMNRETLRSAVFVDIGNAWLNSDDITLKNLKYGVGVGLRWKIKRFVKTDVRFDLARGLTPGGKTKVYLGTKSTF